ncbi:MAG TPA: hypothetical protein DD435_10150, partial [Cyanobacteria bacterium UBA8530]|nr:hypothetical protein [Cyanobacteria bacterium UBA8530]
MRFRKAILLALSLGFGLSYAFPALATKNGDTKVEITKNTTRGVQNGQPGALVEQIKKTYTWSEPDLSALRTFIGANGLVQAPLDRIFQNLAQPMPSPYFQNVANGGTVASFPGWGPTSTAMDSNSNMYAIEGGSYSGSGLVFKKIDAKGNVTQIPVPPEFKISPYYCELTTDSEGNVYLPEEKYQNSAPGNTFC